ncbi:MAG: helix-turn-helix transcriptional regulator [Bacilli bacterium]
MVKNSFDIDQFVAALTPEKAKDNLVNRFVMRRKELHYSQMKLASLSGVSYGSLRRFETSGDISLSSLMNLANVLGYLEDFENLFERPAIRSLKEMK